MAEISRDLINTIIAEAGGEGDEGIIAATWAIAQRAAARGQTMDQVIRSGFDGYTNPGSGALKSQQDPALRRKVESIIQGVQGGTIPNPVPRADHFLSGDVMPSWAREMDHVATINGHRFYASGQVPENAIGIPLPPGQIPNTVATALDVVPPRRVVPVMPTPLPPMLAAQRNLQPVTQDTASLYAGIYPPTPPRAPITDKDLIFDRGIADTVERSQAEQSRDLGAALGTYAQGQRAPGPMSYAAGDRGPRSIASLPFPRPRPENLFGMNGDPGTPAQGTPIPLSPATPRQLPPLPPAARDTAPRMSTAQIRADNGQQGNRPNLFGMNGDPGTPTQGTQVAFTPSGVGMPPATRSVPSMPVPVVPAPPTGPALSRDSVAQSRLGNETVQRLGAAAFAKPSLPMPALPVIPNAIPGPARVPQIADRLSAGTWEVPQATLAATGVVPPAVPDLGVASAMSVVPGFPPMPRNRPLRAGVNVTMPTPLGQRPTLPMPRSGGFSSLFAMPTPVSQRPNPNALRIQVNGAGSYSGSGSSGGSSAGSQPRYVMQGTGKEVRPQVINWFNPDAPNGGAFEKRTVHR